MNFGFAVELRQIFRIALLLPVVLASCRVTSQAITQSQQSQEHDRLEIIYQAHPATGPLFSSVNTVSREIVQTAAEISVDPMPFQNLRWSKAELRIECPHPDGRTNYARVSLHFKAVECGQECARTSWGKQTEDRIESRESRRATFRERWLYKSCPPGKNGETYSEIDLPKTELDAILAELDSHGFFVERERTFDAESQLEVRLNRRWTSKRWEYEPTLDALTTRVYEEGTVKATAVDTGAAIPNRSGMLAWLTPFGRSQ